MTQVILALGNLGGKFVCPVLLASREKRVTHEKERKFKKVYDRDDRWILFTD
jgi:hypothetical protein